MADAELVAQEAVAARLRQNALARIDQDDGEVCGRGAGHHVARILFVARAVRDDELAALGREEAVGDVDGDALLAFGSETVDQKSEVDLLPLRPHPLAVAFQRGELVFENHAAVVEQASDQRGLAVIDAAAGDEAQHRLVLVLVEIGVDVLRDQRVGLVGGLRHQK